MADEKVYTHDEVRQMRQEMYTATNEIVKQLVGLCSSLLDVDGARLDGAKLETIAEQYLHLSAFTFKLRDVVIGIRDIELT